MKSQVRKVADVAVTAGVKQVGSGYITYIHHELGLLEYTESAERVLVSCPCQKSHHGWDGVVSPIM